MKEELKKQLESLNITEMKKVLNNIEKKLLKQINKK
jgi:hypothetical protein